MNYDMMLCHINLTIKIRKIVPFQCSRSNLLNIIDGKYYGEYVKEVTYEGFWALQ